MSFRHFVCLGILMNVFASASTSSAQESSDLAKAAQNPISDLISLPLQWNTNLKVGPLDKPQHVLNIQPVLPISLNDDWNVVTRTILPIISQPALGGAQSRETGIGDIQFSAFFSPKQPTAGGWIWGAGSVLQFDTASDERLGQGAWGLGPTAVTLRITGPWVYGGLVNNIWSVSENSGRSEVNQFLFQPFVNYNFPQHPGRYLTFAPVITANWEAEGDKWLVPLGLGIGQIMRFGKQPVNLQASFYHNVERPDFAPEYQVRLQVQLMFPK